MDSTEPSEAGGSAGANGERPRAHSYADEYKARRARLGMGTPTVPIVTSEPKTKRRVTADRPRSYDPRKRTKPGSITHRVRLSGDFVRPRFISIHSIKEDVCERHNITMAEIEGETRRGHVVRARQEAMWIAVRETGRSLPVIAAEFGDRDHTTVYHALKRHQARIDSGEIQPVSYGGEDEPS